MAVVFFVALIFWTIGSGFGAFTAQAFLWNIGSTEDVQISQNESQMIKNIDVKSSEYNITISVGEMVEAGATFDNNSSSYDILNGQRANESEVLIKNASTPNATIIITNSALDSTDNFDMKISGIDTTGISMYDRELSKKNRILSYEFEQNDHGESSEFSINSPYSVSFADSQYVSKNQSVELDSVQLEEGNVSEVVVWSISSNGEINERLGSSTDGDSIIEINSSSIEGESDIAVTIESNQNQTNHHSIYAVDTTKVTIPVAPEVIQNPAYYPDYHFESDSKNGFINAKFNTNLSDKSGNITLNYGYKSNKTISLRDDKDKYSISGNELRIPVLKENSTSNYTQIKRLVINDLNSTTGGELESQIYHPDRVSKVISYENNVTVIQGTTIAINTSNGTNTLLHSKTQNITHNTTSGYNNTVLFETSSVSTGEYIIESDSDINGTTVKLVPPEQAINIPSEGLVNDTTIEVQGVTSEDILVINTTNKSGSINKKHHAYIKDSDIVSIPLEFPHPGDYTVQIDGLHTRYSTVENIAVVNNKSTNLSNIHNRNQISTGQKTEMTLNGTYNTSFLELLDTKNQSTAATLELTTPTDDDIPVTFNTYAAGDPSLAENLITVGANATVESVETSTPNETLSPGTYTLSARSEYGSVTTSANTTIDIEARETRDLTTYTTSALDPSELQSTGEIAAAVADGILSPSTTVNDTETVVYAVDASGLDGAPAVRTDEFDTGADVAAFDGFAFGVRSTTTEFDSASDSTTQASTSDGDELGSIPANATVHVDNERFYLVAAGDAALATEDSPSDGDEFTATFRVDDERLRASAPGDDDHVVNTTLTYAAPDQDAADGHDDPADAPDRDDAGGSDAGSGGGDGGGSGGGGDVSGGGGGSSGAPSDEPGGETSGRGDSLDTPQTPETQAEEAASGSGVDGAPADRVAPQASIEAHAVADLQAAYRDRPDSVSNATGTDWRSEAASGGDSAGNASATARTDSSDAAESRAPADRRDSERSTATPESPDYDNAPIRSTAYDVPGFGPVVTLVALVSASLLALRRP